MSYTPSATAPDPQPNTAGNTGVENGRWCVEHGVTATFDVDCFRCLHDNAVIGPAVR